MDENKSNNTPKAKLNESTDKLDWLKMWPEVALLSSMRKSKTLTVMVIVALSLFAGFGYSLVKMAANT